MVMYKMSTCLERVRNLPNQDVPLWPLKWAMLLKLPGFRVRCGGRYAE